MTILSNTNSFIIGALEKFFLRWGRLVSLHPYPVILTSIIITTLSSFGFLMFRIEHRASHLWIPLDSDYNKNEAWLDLNFKVATRDQLIMYQSENILTPESLQEMYRLYNRIINIEVEGKTFHDICARIPISDILQTKKRRKRQASRGIRIEEPRNLTKEYDEDYDIWAEELAEYEEDPFSDPEEDIQEDRINFKKYGKKKSKTQQEDAENTRDDLPDQIYCDLVETLNEKCIQYSFLGAWRYDEQLILTTTREEILEAVNTLERSPWFGYPINYSSSMGGITRNRTGHIVGAKSAQMYWSIRVPDNADLVNNQASGLELQLADRVSLAWEDKFVDIGLNSTTVTATVIPNANKSFGDISSQAIFFDAFLMAGGYLIMFVYTILMLGRLNRKEARIYLSISGIASIGMAIFISVGISSILGFPYTPMHAILPFICLGIGIDDMFVIMQCFENINRDKRYSSIPIPDKIGQTLRHAGVSITVTSLTDIFAFGIGAVTRMPGLQSFCVCTAIALASVFLLTVTWFVAWLSIDEKRVEAGRDAFLPCFEISEKYKTLSCFRMTISWKSVYSIILSSTIYRALIVVLSLILLGIGCWGAVLIEQRFEPKLLLPADSYLRRWLEVHDNLYPRNGHSADVYFGQFNWTHLESLDNLTERFSRMEKEGKVLRAIESWWIDMKKFAFEKQNFTSWQDFANQDNFQMLLSDFLFSADGSSAKSNFRFNGTLKCNQHAPPVIGTKFRVNYLQFSGPQQHIPARKAVDDAIMDEFGTDAFSFTKIYAAWETDEIIGFELWRNIGLAMTCVFLVTLVLLANLPICIMVLISVIFTLIDIVGFLHFWDMTIDVISCVNIVLAIGLCVDYSVHIGHAYMVCEGSRSERAQEAVFKIGLAVLNGGVTTFLALVLLGGSSSHAFISFFKVFVLTVVFGLFHGLLLFPMLLSILGPSSPVSPPSLESSPGRENHTFISDLETNKEQETRR